MSSVILFYHQNDSYGCFSNFYPISFIDNDIVFCCSEQRLMYEKAKLFDQSMCEIILNSSNPTIIKNLGRQIKNFNQIIWDEKKYQIMVDTLFLKFSQNSEICKILLNTNNKLLAEASPYDFIWGIGLSKEKALNVLPCNWKGQNLLGKALMEVREKLNNMANSS